MPLSYRQVKDLYDILHQAGATQLDLPSWAQQMQGDTGSDLYSAGLNDNLIKRASVGIDRALEATGLPDVGASLGRSVSEPFGMGDTGAEIGHGLPRMAVNFLPIMAAEAVSGGAATPAILPFLGAAGTGALAGAETYTETGSPAAGLLSGITNAVLPAVAGKAEQGTLAFLRNQGLKRGVSEELLPRLVEGANATSWADRFTPNNIEAVSQLFPRSGTFQGLAANAGGQLAAAGLMGASDIGQDVLAGRDVRNPFSPEMALNLTLGQLPFSLLHLGGKALGLGPKFHGIDEQGNTFTRPLTADDAANALQHSIDYTKAMVDRRAREEAMKGKGISGIADAKPNYSEEQQKAYEAAIADLSQKQADLQANPTPENIAELEKVNQQKEDTIAKAVKDNVAGLGTSKPYAAAIPVTGENHYRKDDTGYNVITVKDFPEGLTYNDGTPVQAGDRISFSDGKFPSGVNKDGTNKFELGVGKDGKKYFTKVIDKKEVVPGEVTKGPNLPLQQAEFNHQQYSENLRALSEIEGQVPENPSATEGVDFLEKVNEVRRQIGYPEISLPSLLREAKRRKLKSDKDAFKALINETKRMQLAEQQANQTHMDSLKNEVAFRTKLSELAKTDPKLKEIEDLYEKYSKAGGNREEIASSGLFWKKAMELAADPKKELNAAQLNGALAKAIAHGEGLSGKVQAAPQFEGPVFKALSAEDETAYQLGAEAVLRVTANAPRSDEAAVFKRVITNAAEGNVKDISQLFGKEAIAEAIVDLGLSEAGPDANIFAEDILKSPLVKDWVKQLSNQAKHLPAPFIEGEFEKLSKVGRPEEKQPSAGGDFVWGMQNYDPIQNKLGKHTLPKTGILNENAFKQAAGRGKPLQDVEIEIMKAVDKTVGGGAFKDGMVDVRKLESVLRENPVEVHVYGQEGPSNASRTARDQMTHDWYDNLDQSTKLTIRDSIESGRVDSITERRLNPEILAKLKEYIKLSHEAGEFSSESEKATHMYDQISPVRKDLKWTWKGKQYSSEIQRIDVRVGGDRVLFHGDRKNGGVHDYDNTLGWLMFQLVPGKDGEPIMLVGEQQSRWGQEVAKDKKEIAKQLGSDSEAMQAAGKRAQDRIVDHPLLPIQHLLVLKAAASEAARRGVTKMVVSDGETAMMTEMHDKNATTRYVPVEGGKNKVVGEPYTFNWNTNLPKGWKQIESVNGKIIASDPEGKLYHIKAVDSRYPIELDKSIDEQHSPGSGLYKVQIVASPVEKVTNVEQAGGMRLHYDTTLASAAKKLTGSEGEKVEMGTHKNVNALADEDTMAKAEEINKQFHQGKITEEERQAKIKALQPGSPVFKEADGSPKSSITGRLYDLSSIQETARQQGGLTLGDPSRAGKPEAKLKLYDPSPAEKPIHDILSGTGEDHAQHLLTSPDPEYRALAKDLLASFPESLRVAKGYVLKGLGLAATAARRGEMGSNMYFSPELLGMSRLTQDSVIIHELGHALSLSLFERGLDPVMEAKLESIRQRAIAALPKKLKAQYEKAVAENFLKRSQTSGDVDLWDQLAPSAEGFTDTDRQILYGLLDNKELISQSWNTDTFKNYLKKIPGKVNGLKAFINWTKELFGFGDKHDSLLHELIETSHSLMSQGEYLTSLQEYGKAHFDMKGMDPVYGKTQTDRGIELMESAKFGITPGEIAGNLDSSQGRANPELNVARTRVDKVLQDPEDINHQGIKDSLAEWGHEETTKGIDNMVVTALDEGHDLGEALVAMPLPMAKYIYEKLKDQKDVVEMLQAASAEKNKGVLNIAKPELVRGPLFEVGKRIDKMLEGEAKEEESAQDLLKLSAIDPFGFLKSQVALSRVGKPEEKPEGKIPVDRAWVSRFLETMGNMALRFPEVAEIISKGFQLVANGRKLQNSSLKIFGSNLKSEYLDVTDKESVAHMKKMMSDPHLRDGVYKWIGENQFRNKDGVVMLDEGDPVIAKLRQRYTSEQWEIVRDFVTKQGLSRQKFNDDKLKFLQTIAGVRGAGIISESGLKTGENIAIADAMLKAVQGMKDPLAAEGAKAQFEDIRRKLQNPDDFMALLNYSKGEVEKLDMLKESLDKNPFWAPAQRMEQYLVEGLKNGKAWTQSYSSKKEAEIEVKKNGVTLLKPIKDQWAGMDDVAFQVPGLTPGMLERAKEIEQNQIKILTKAGVIKNADDLEKYYQSSITTQMAREADKGTGTSGLAAPPRNLSKGAEDLPWLRNHIVGIQREARYLSRQLLRTQADTYLKHPELRGDEQLRNDLKTHFENILHPDPQLAQQMTRFASTWFMGFNLASTLVNATQPFLTHVSELTAMTGRPLESYRRVTRALKEAIAGLHGKKAWATAEHEKLMKEEAEAGDLDMSMWDTEAQDHESVSTDLLRALDKQKPQTLGQKLSSAAGVYSTVAMMPFKAVERINAGAALLASFDYYREQGLSYEEAKEKAQTFNRGVNYSGGRGQRPVLAFAGRGSYPRGSAMLGTALQSYVLGTTGQIARYLQSGLFRPKGLTPYETYSARKAAAQMLGTQLAAAGLLGLPFVSGAIALLDKLFPDLELNKHVREGVGKFLSSDSENGSPLSDIAMTGVPSMMGWDLQSRLSMGNTLPGVSEVNGFQPENLIGPVANIVKNFVDGVQGWTQGDSSATQKFLPPAARKLIETGKSVLTDGGAIRDYQGRPLADATLGERLGMGIGFQPKRLSDQNAASRILKQTQDVASQQNREEVGKMAQEVMKGNYGTVRQTILSRMQSDKEYNPEDAVRAIAQSVEDSTLPRDLRREGDVRTANSRSGLLSSFSNLSSGSVSEVQRLQLRQEVERKLGLVRKQDGAVKLAQLMDQLKTANPSATRVQLKQQAQQLLRRSQPQTLQMSQE